MDRERAIRIARQDVITGMLMGDSYVPLSSEPVEIEVGGGDADSASALEALRVEHEKECPHCTSVEGWTSIVFGEGDPDAGLMFVGEAPGAEEDKQGRPFVGRSGALLESMIKAMGLRRETVYIANVLKTRPPNNRTPTPDEAALCGRFLRRQIGIIRPEVIVTLGRPAAQLLLETKESMSRMRGQWFEYEGTPVMPTFHPAFLLRQYTQDNRAKVWSDLQLAMGRLGLR
ncbi:MAG: uracil-DNA glycosylase [Planctomycetota bacterium]|jgi:DNA polymerase